MREREKERGRERDEIARYRAQEFGCPTFCRTHSPTKTSLCSQGCSPTLPPSHPAHTSKPYRQRAALACSYYNCTVSVDASIKDEKEKDEKEKDASARRISMHRWMRKEYAEVCE